MASYTLLGALCLLYFPAVVLSLESFDYVSKVDGEKCPRMLLTWAGDEQFDHLPGDAFTMCFHVFVERSTWRDNEKDATFISYSSKKSGDYNEVVLSASFDPLEPYTALRIGDAVTLFDDVPVLNDWTHVCASWTSDSGTVRLYLNGEEVEGDGKEIKKGYTIGGDGDLVVGNDQDGFNSDFDPLQGVDGRISGFNIWDKELTEDEVQDVNGCDLEGNFASWSTSKWGLYDNVVMEPSKAPCYTKCGKVEITPCVNEEATFTAPYDLDEGFDDGFPKQVTATVTKVKFRAMKIFSVCLQLYNAVPLYELKEILLYKDSSGQTHMSFGYMHVLDEDYAALYWTIGDEKEGVSFQNLGKYATHPICFTWNSEEGELNFYYKYESAATVPIGKGYVLPGGGKFTVTQEQYDILGVEDGANGFTFQVTDVYAWDRSLTEEQVAGFKECTGYVGGTLFTPSTSEWDEDHACPSHSVVSPVEWTDAEMLDNGKVQPITATTRSPSKIPDVPVPPELSEMTLCFWAYSRNDNPTVEEFISNKAGFNVSLDNGVILKFGDETVKFKGKNFFGGGSWRYVCISWSGEDGVTTLYVDGDVKSAKSNFANGQKIAADIEWSVTNLQDYMTYDGYPTYGFIWKVTDFNIWDYVRDEDEVAKSMKCSLELGNALNARTTFWKE